MTDLSVAIADKKMAVERYLKQTSFQQWDADMNMKVAKRCSDDEWIKNIKTLMVKLEKQKDGYQEELNELNTIEKKNKKAKPKT